MADVTREQLAAMCRATGADVEILETAAGYVLVASNLDEDVEFFALDVDDPARSLAAFMPDAIAYCRTGDGFD